MVNTAMNHSRNPWLLWVPDHRSDLTTFKTQVKSRAADEWFHSRVLNILFTSFLIVHRSVHHQIAVYLAFFTITLTIIRSTFRQRFFENRAQEIEKNKLRLISFVYTLTKYAIRFIFPYSSNRKHGHYNYHVETKTNQTPKVQSQKSF